MKKWKFTIALAFYLGMTATANMSGQGILWVKQVITANSGKFEYTPPYQDYVSLQSFHVQSQAVSVFGTIYTQSAQDICIFKNAAYVASQD